jgi:cytochrome c biogenesis protein ResB
MSLRRVVRAFVSARATVALLCLVALLLLLNVVIPQEAVLGPERFAALIEGSGPVARFFLLSLGLSALSTSPVFLAVLVLFFLNLGLVLATRIGPTWRRTKLPDRSGKKVRGWTRARESFVAPRPPDFDAAEVTRILRGLGFQVRRQEARSYWGVKHRTAPLGFLLFHLSFFLMCGGGLMLWATRFVGVATLSEGQEFTGEYSQVLRRPPIGRVPTLRLVAEEIETEVERGEPVHLSAQLRFRQGLSAITLESRVNHPAEWGTSSILVERAGLAPILWLQDENGFTLDRVVVPVQSRGGEPTALEVADERYTVILFPLSPGVDFPTRSERSRTPLRLQVIDGETLVFDGELRQGAAADLGAARLVLEEVRSWVGIRVVSERGGGLLSAGFVVGILGLIWRLMWYRREVIVEWDEREIRVVGRAEYFSHRFRTELRELSAMLGGRVETGAGLRPGGGV